MDRPRARRLVWSDRARQVLAITAVLIATLGLLAAVAAARKRNGSIFFWRANNILAIHPDGSGLHRVTHNGCQPSVSPDGREVVFTDAQCGGGALLVMNANGSDRRSISVATGADSPSFSPGGQQIVFDDFQSSIYLVNVDGSGLRRLHHFSAFPHQPVFSPDGKTILYDLEGRRTSLYFMNSDGTHVRPVPQGGGALDASFSPSGRSILFVRGNGIFRMSSTGAHLKRLTTAPSGGEDLNPAFSPDGTKIVFNRQDNPQHFSGIMVMNGDGSHLHVLTQNPFSSGWPAWQPLG